MLGAFVYGKFCGENAADYVSGLSEPVLYTDMIEAERKRIMAPLSRPERPAGVRGEGRRGLEDWGEPGTPSPVPPQSGRRENSAGNHAGIRVAAPKVSLMPAPADHHR